MDNLSTSQHMDGFEFGTTAWYVMMVLAGLAVGVVIAVARTLFERDD